MIAETESPKALEVISEGIPDELKARPQWVCWRYALDSKNRWTKHPYNPRTGRMASRSDLMTWGGFETVHEAYETGRYDGVGFIFCSGEDPYTGVDLDGCRDPETGEVDLYADFELDTEEQNRRVRRIVKGAALAHPPEHLLYLPALGYGPVEALREAYAECSRRDVKLLILDSFGPAMQGDSEAARDMIGFFSKIMEPFRALGVAVLIIDHQARTQAGERYQNKSAFGSVYKTNLTRSVVQIEATERGEDYVGLRLRQESTTSGLYPILSEPRSPSVIAWSWKVRELDETDLAEEGTLNASDRAKLALQNGPAYPDELAERTGLALGTIKNALTKLRRAGMIEPTGEKRAGGQEQLTLPVTKSSSLSLLLRTSDDDDTSKPRSRSLKPRESDTLEGLGEHSPEEERRVRKLVKEGMSGAWARRSVLANDHPLGRPQP